MVKLSELTSFTENFASTFGEMRDILQVIHIAENNHYWLISNVLYSYFIPTIYLIK